MGAFGRFCDFISKFGVLKKREGLLSAVSRYLPGFLELESRVMFDGAAVVDGVDHLLQGDHSEADSHHLSFSVELPFSTSGPVRELVVVDPSVPDFRTLLDALPHQAEVLILDPNRDGVAQVALYMANHRENERFSAIRLVTHGASGSLQIGSTLLDAHTLDSHLETLREWSVGLTVDADMLIYGCNIAQGEIGEKFIARLAEATGVDVAASDNLTGDAAQGGDWILEKQVGTIAAQPTLSYMENYHGLLNITVTSLADNTNSDGLVTLREAILAANTDASVDGSEVGGGADTIVFSSSLANGTINLTSTLLPTTAMTIDGDADGDSVGDITLSGGSSNIQGMSITGALTIRNLTLDAFNGGGLYLNSGAANTLSLDHAKVSSSGNPIPWGQSGSIQYGGGIYVGSGATLNVIDSTLIGNSSGSRGGGIYNSGGTVNLIQSHGYTKCCD